MNYLESWRRGFVSLEVVKRIAIDMDEVMADTMAHFLEKYNDSFGVGLTTQHFQGRHVFEVIEEAHKPAAREYFQQESFFAEIPVMPDSVAVVEELTKRYDVFITTAAMDVPCSFTPKFEWLRQHFPFIPTSNIVFCGDKSIIAADFLIDDNIRHLSKFKGEGIIYTAPHNVNETRFRRVGNWLDVRGLFLS
jgi:5'(3')-deoxyribonucleotidase